MPDITINHILILLVVFSAGLIVYVNLIQRKYYSLIKWREEVEDIFVRAVTKNEIFAIDVDFLEQDDDEEEDIPGNTKECRYKAFIVSERIFKSTVDTNTVEGAGDSESDSGCGDKEVGDKPEEPAEKL